MKIAWALVVIFFARFAVSAWFYTGADADLAWQQWLGNVVLHAHRIPAFLGSETFTASGSPWVAQEWLFSTAVAAALQGGWFFLLALFVAGCAAAAMLVTARRCVARGASPFATSVVIACVGFAMMQSFGVRAQILGWLALALVMLLLDSESPWLFAAVPVIAVWANLHASALIAPVFVGAWACGIAIEDRAWTPRVRRAALLTLASCAAVCLTPFLWHLPQYAVLLETSAFRTSISEWQPSDILYPAMSAGVLPLIALCCFFGIAAPRERWRDGLLFGVASVLAFSAVRHLPLCALVIAPMAAVRLSNAIPQRSRINTLLAERAGIALAYAAASVASLLIAVTLVRTPAVAGNNLPRAAVERLGAISGTHRLYCEDFAWCSLALGEPNVRVFLDGRCDPFPQRIWDAYLTVQRAEPKWYATLDRYDVNAVLALNGRPLATLLRLRAGWRPVYHDRRYTMFLRQEERTASR